MLLRPVYCLGDCLWGAISSQAVVHPFTVLFTFHKSRLLEDGHMLGDSGRRQAQKLDNLADAKLARIKSHQNPDHVFVAQGFSY